MSAETSGDSQPDYVLPDNLPVLTCVAEPGELPVLTEIAAPELVQRAPELTDEEIRHLVKQLEAHIEAVFTQKLNLHLEKLQRLAVKQAVSEFRAALPQLLRDVRNGRR